MDHQDLARLVEQAQNGSVEAFAQIYSEVSKPLYYYALRMTKNEHDAKDIVQETMIEVYKHLGELKNPGALKAYVNSVAYRRSLNLLSKQKRQQSDDIDEMVDLTDNDEDFIPEEYAESQERREYIISLVDALPDAQRTVVLLYYYKQLSSKEIAETLGIEDGAVRARLNRARNTLKQKLQADEARQNSAGGAALLLAIPVLTQIFNTEATTVFVAGIGRAIWESVGIQLGFSAAAISATTSVATAGTATAAGAVGTAAGVAAATVATVAGTAGASIFSGSLLTVAAIGLFSTAVIAGVVLTDQTKTPLPVPTPESSYVQDVSVSTSTVPGQAIPQAAEAPLSKEGIFVEHDTLYYSAGEDPSVTEIMSAAGVTAFDADGSPTDITVLGYENIDFSVPDDYYVTFEIIDADQESIWKAVIIVVE